MKKNKGNLLDTFESNVISKMNLLVGGATTSKEDCNASSYDDDNSTWRKDSTDTSDTVRADDGCNE